MGSGQGRDSLPADAPIDDWFDLLEDPSAKKSGAAGAGAANKAPDAGNLSGLNEISRKVTPVMMRALDVPPAVANDASEDLWDWGDDDVTPTKFELPPGAKSVEPVPLPSLSVEGEGLGEEFIDFGAPPRISSPPGELVGESPRRSVPAQTMITSTSEHAAAAPSVPPESTPITIPTSAGRFSNGTLGLSKHTMVGGGVASAPRPNPSSPQVSAVTAEPRSWSPSDPPDEAGPSHAPPTATGAPDDFDLSDFDAWNDSTPEYGRPVVPPSQAPPSLPMQGTPRVDLAPPEADSEAVTARPPEDSIPTPLPPPLRKSLKPTPVMPQWASDLIQHGELTPSPAPAPAPAKTPEARVSSPMTPAMQPPVPPTLAPWANPQEKTTPIAPPPASFLLNPRQQMHERFDLGDFTSALATAEALLLEDSDDDDARHVAEVCRTKLRAIYVGRLGSLDQVPTMAVAPSELRWLSLDHRSGFVLSLIDGASSIEDILDIAGMPSLEVLRTLYMLTTQNVIALQRRRGTPRR